MRSKTVSNSSPWNAYGWRSDVIDLDRDLIDRDNRIPWDESVFALAEVEAEWSTDGDDWDGTFAALCRLTDGRWLAYETFWGPTGDGFCEDAYGGDADVFVGSNREDVIRFGLTDEGRAGLGLTLSAVE